MRARAAAAASAAASGTAAAEGGAATRLCRSRRHARACGLLLLLLCAVPRAACGDADALGWARGADASLAGPCTVARRDAAELTQAEFDAVYRETLPVVLTGIPDNARFRALCAKERLLADWGEHTIVLSTANTYSYSKVHTTLAQYVAQHMAPQTEASLGNETLYHFGDNDHAAWAPLLSAYVQPPFIPPSAAVSLSFGLAGPGSGVPFHIHGAGYSEPLVGRKRWLLYPPAQRPAFDPDESTLAWVRRRLSGGAQQQLPPAPPLECTIGPGEALYFPSRWWHATLNVDEAVFMSTFVTYAPPQQRDPPFVPRRAAAASTPEAQPRAQTYELR